MFFYLRNLNTGKNWLVDVDPREPVEHLRAIFSEKDPQWIPQRLLFAGQVLDDSALIGHCGIYKECTVQIQAKKVTNNPIDPNADDSLPKTTTISLLRQVTDKEIQYGDVVIVKIRRAKNLSFAKAGKNPVNLKPYVMLSCGPWSQRSTPLKGPDPLWKEVFGFIFDTTMPETETIQLTVMCFFENC
jgi:hypothetical protein